jgi:hypothetical protein
MGLLAGPYRSRAVRLLASLSGEKKYNGRPCPYCRATLRHTQDSQLCCRSVCRPGIREKERIDPKSTAEKSKAYRIRRINDIRYYYYGQAY